VRGASGAQSDADRHRHRRTALLLLHTDYPGYFVAAQPIHLLLGPAVVALAVPLYRHITLVRERAALLVAALLVGSMTAVIGSVIAGWLLGLPRAELLSLAPKSATAAVSMPVAGKIGGIPAVTAVLTILTGITGAVVAPLLLNALRIRDPAARGFGMGLASHGTRIPGGRDSRDVLWPGDGAERCRHLHPGAAPGPAAAALMRFSGTLQECPYRAA
jgi:uncharacterized membrane protein YeaQ/YmgE (transglycosylase-associated protein family)